MYGKLLGIILSGLLSQSYGKYWQPPPCPVPPCSVPSDPVSICANNGVICKTICELQTAQIFDPSVQPMQAGPYEPYVPKPTPPKPTPPTRWGNTPPQYPLWWKKPVQDDSKSVGWNPPSQSKLGASKPTTTGPESVYDKKAKLLESSSNERDSKGFNTFRTSDNVVVQGYNPQYPQYMDDSLDPEECRNHPGKCLNVY